MRRPRPAAALALGVAALLACGRDPAARPHVVLVSVDTLRADALSAYGGPLPTPGFDGLLGEGVRLARAYAPSAETAPSHATLLTGQEVPRHGVLRNGMALPGEAHPLAESFLEAGYRTGAFVSSWVLDAGYGWSQGFEVYDSQFPEGSGTLNKARPYPDAIFDASWEGALDRRAEDTTERALSWLATGAGDPRPCFLFVHYFDPHSPYAPPSVFARRAVQAPLVVSGRAVPGIRPRLLELMIRGYYGEVLYLDAMLVGLRQLVDELAAGREVLWVVTADHGEGLGQHGWLEHLVHLHDELVHVPLGFAWKGRLPAGRTLATPVGLVDVAPTVLELTGLPAPTALDGRSLAEELGRGREPPPRPVFGFRRALAHPPAPALAGRRVSVRLGGWTYIRPDDAEEELYDVSADPGETQNLASAHPGERRRLAALVQGFLDGMPYAEATPEVASPLRRRLEALGYVE
jgi:arylsulfatase A-like enzyme